MKGITAKRSAETLPVRRAYGRVAADNVVAPVDVPPLATSHMDGFAVISSDVLDATESVPARLIIAGEAGPGVRPKHLVRSGEAVQVATGAVLPAGADAVVPSEFAEVDGREVLVKRAAMPGSYVYGAGEDVRKGEVVLSKGRSIRAQDMGMMIALGLIGVKVWKRPKVSVIATGSELTAASRPKEGKTRESHSPVILRLCATWGCIPVDMGIVRDDSDMLVRTLKRALATSDFVLTLGGTSAGQRDLVIGAVSTLKPDVLVHGIKLDRGRVTGIAAVRGSPILMLPGPIQAAMNAFLVLGTPVLEKLSGNPKIGLEMSCKMGEDWEPRKRFADFQKVVYVKLRHGEEIVAEPISAETESLKLLAEADGYVVVPEEVGRISKGSQVKVRLVPGFSYV